MQTRDSDRLLAEQLDAVNSIFVHGLWRADVVRIPSATCWTFDGWLLRGRRGWPLQGRLLFLNFWNCLRFWFCIFGDLLRRSFCLPLRFSLGCSFLWTVTRRWGRFRRSRNSLIIRKFIYTIQSHHVQQAALQPGVEKHNLLEIDTAEKHNNFFFWNDSVMPRDHECRISTNMLRPWRAGLLLEPRARKCPASQA